MVANIVPTGVRAEIGGWIGDATPATNVLKERMTAKGLVDPRAASEVVSPGYLGSVLRGLHQSPRPVDPSFLAPNDITLNDVNALQKSLA